MSNQDVLLRVEHLTTVFEMESKTIRAVDEVSFVVRRGETLGLVGESGSGKSVTALSILRLVQPPGRISNGVIEFDGRDLLSLDEQGMRNVRGAAISLVFQEPMTALNPVVSVGDHVAESLIVHDLLSRREARQRAVELLEAVRIPNPERRARDYPHQLSGGMRQRVMIAIALSCKPSLVIADEPTTALDVTIQAEILELLRELKTKLDLSLLLITHDLGVIAETADRVAVMYAGRIVEQATVHQIFKAPRHPYTKGLLASIPGGRAGERLKAIQGAVPDLGALPRGCAFAPRCPEQFLDCLAAPPSDVSVGSEHHVRCYLYPPDDAR